MRWVAGRIWLSSLDVVLDPLLHHLKEAGPLVLGHVPGREVLEVLADLVVLL